MKIEPQKIPIRDVAEGYADNDEEGVVGYGGRLNIRPKYQREFVYDEKKRDAVIESIRNRYPLNVMYWIKNDEGAFEILDGQQRTVSFCRYVNGDFSIDGRTFHNLTETEKRVILDHDLTVYFCEGNDREILDWFKVINIAGEKLTDQELRNALYTGAWLTHAKSIFSKTGCAAHLLSKDYVNGVPIRQHLLETAIKWVNGGKIEEYMSVHQHYPNANELWTYFRGVVEWVKLTFTTYRREMKGVEWGPLYDAFKDKIFDTKQLEDEIRGLMMDDDVGSKRGIYPFVLTRDERHLSIRAFSEGQRRGAYERQNKLCAKCGGGFDLKDMEADHITPWSKGGKTAPDNCQMLCKDCNRRKGGA